MNANDTIMVTAEGLAKLESELAERLVRRKQIADKIEYAKSLGDLSENFEYQEAKEDQALNESRVMELQDMISRSVVSQHAGGATISLGSKIVVSVNGQERELTIVSFNEADPANGLISNASPIGLALLGRTKGEKVDITTPRGLVVYQVKKVS